MNLYTEINVMLSEERKRYIVNEHLRIVHIISDEAYHRRVWINRDPQGLILMKSAALSLSMAIQSWRIIKTSFLQRLNTRF